MVAVAEAEAARDKTWNIRRKKNDHASIGVATSYELQPVYWYT